MFQSGSAALVAFPRRTDALLETRCGDPRFGERTGVSTASASPFRRNILGFPDLRTRLAILISSGYLLISMAFNSFFICPRLLSHSTRLSEQTSRRFDERFFRLAHRLAL